MATSLNKFRRAVCNAGCSFFWFFQSFSGSAGIGGQLGPPPLQRREDRCCEFKGCPKNAEVRRGLT